MIRVAVIGAGYWGPNLIRTFHDLATTEVVWVADQDAERLRAVQSHYPDMRLTTDALEAIRDPSVDAVIVATPTHTHYRLIKESLTQHKHVFTEKPLTTNLAEAKELCVLAERTQRVLLVDHIFLYNPAVQHTKTCLDAGTLGSLYSIACTRTNLGPLRTDVNVVWDLASQDIAIVNYWLGSQPLRVSAQGGSWINPPLIDTAFVSLRYPDNVLVQLHCSWLHPHKMREITLVGAEKMLTYNDMDWAQPIRVYDKKVASRQQRVGFDDTIEKFRSSIIEGSITIPTVEMTEPLKVACAHFLACITSGVEPLSGGRQGAEVVHVLEAIERSLQNGGREEVVQDLS